MFCSKCGSVNEPDSKFCGSCGKPIPSENKETKIEAAKSERNLDGSFDRSQSFNLPWGGGSFWLYGMAGEAQQVKVQKRNVVHTTTRYDRYTTSNYDYMSGRYISGDITVPVNEVHTETEVESEFWLTDKNGKEKHFTFNHEIVPMKNGQRISVIWGALTGTENGKYKCIYNHETGDFKTLPGSYGDIGVFSAPAFGMNTAATAARKLLLWGVIIGFVIGFSIGNNAGAGAHMMATMLTWAVYGSIPSLLMYLWYLRLKRSWEKEDAVVKGKVEAITKIIVKYASAM